MKITVLGSGSEGNSTLLEINNKKILIDVGFSYKLLTEKLKSINITPNEIDYILITHEHNDHIRGLKVFTHKNDTTLFIREKIINTILENREQKNVKILENEINIDNIKIKALPLSHDVTDPVGFLIEYQNESLVYITDTGYIHYKVLNLIKNKTYYIIESNHDTEMLLNGPYPPYLIKRILSDYGHLSNEFCGKYLTTLIGENTKEIILAHLSKNNNTPNIALHTVKKILEEHDIKFNNIKCASEEEMIKINDNYISSR